MLLNSQVTAFVEVSSDDLAAFHSKFREELPDESYGNLVNDFPTVSGQCGSSLEGIALRQQAHDVVSVGTDS